MIGIRVSPTIARQKRRGRSFYVAANGSDSNSGRSPASPWQTVQKVSDYVYEFGLRGGDRVLLRKGDTFTNLLYINNEATPFSVRGIEINSYGNGTAKPFVQVSGTDERAAILYNQVFRVKNLKFGHTNRLIAGDAIQIFVSDPIREFSNIQVVNCEVDGGLHGIRIYAYNGTSRFSNVLIQGNTIAQCVSDGIYANSDPVSTLTNSVFVRYNNVSNIRGNGLTAQGGTGNAIYIGDIKNSILEYNYADGAGCTHGAGNNLIWIYRARNSIVRNNTAINGSGQIGTYDRGGVGLDQNCEDCIMEKNFAYFCQGEGLYISYGKRNIIRFNVVINCAYDSLGLGALQFEGGMSTPPDLPPSENTQIYNNTIVCNYKSPTATYDPIPFVSRLKTNTGFVANNIFATNLSHSKVVEIFAINGLTFRDNNYYAASGTPLFKHGNNVLSGLSNFRVHGAREKNGTTNYGYSIDPTFSNPSGTTANAFQLTGSTLPKGVNLNTVFGVTPPSTDYYGNPINPAALAIGAHIPTSFTPAATPATSNQWGVYMTPLVSRLASSYTASELADLQTFLIAANQNGALDRLEFLYLFNFGKSQSDAFLNLLSTSFNASTAGTGGVTFTAKSGIRTTGTACVNTNFFPVAGTKFLTDDCSFGVWIPNGRSTASGGNDMTAVTSGSTALTLNYRFTGNLLRARLNDNGSGITTAFAGCKMIGSRRTSSATIELIRDASIVATGSAASTGRTASAVVIGAGNNGGTLSNFTSELYANAWMGAALTNQQLGDLYNAMYTLSDL